MLISEFIEGTGYMPTYDEYRALESLYYDFKDGDKFDFCAYFKSHKVSMLNKAREIACASFAKEREKLVHEKNAAECKIAEVTRLKDTEISCKEREWSNERANYERSLSDLQSRYDWMKQNRDELREELNEKTDALNKALSDIESLKNALRLLKE